eukprot:CAMPEP_0168606404 /NCGR_PEP_ID=MMETSP0420-20121227/16552_1 /TAXON_ID=498008 /ORGANISM="Pessonella sp." /LENGTH=179 /DNA_ID=CAMNT_0008646065 /DNA_START=478 /DNA_END=1014 /DNA_ORIENTATION=-
MSLLRFKAVMDDSHLYDKNNDLFYVQADYDQRPTGLCRGGKELCLLHIQASTGNVTNILQTPFTVYKYEKEANPEKALAWMEGSNGKCPKTSTSQDFWFGIVNLKTGSASKISCVAPKDIIQMDEWVAAFDKSNSFLATGSRFSDNTQLIVFNVQSGKEHLNTKLPGLAKELKTKMGLY